MARIGINSWVASGAGRWQVHFGNAIRPPGSTDGRGGLGFWWVHEVVKRDAPPFWGKFRVQRDAQAFADRMNLRYP